MTPDGSQSSEELLNGEENSAAPSSTSSKVQIRVKNVTEINSNEAEATPTPPAKRKLPSWMLPSSQKAPATSCKKMKTPSQEIAYSSACNSSITTRPESATPSTSSNNIQEQEATDEPIMSKTDTNSVDSTDEVSANGEPSVTGNKESNIESSGAADEQRCRPSSLLQTVKAEPNDNEEDNNTVGHITPTSPRDIKPAVKVEKEEATSSTTRVSCKFGIRCYRQNPIHRREEAHPGDKDYRRPDFPAPPDGTPDCPYGDLCYRRNPMHFQQFSHPPSTDFEQNWKNWKMRLRQRQQQVNSRDSSHSDLDDDYDLDDPFINDYSEDEFIPSADSSDDDDFL